METSIGVFGEELILWACMLRQSAQRPAPQHVHHQANHMLNELKGSSMAQELPVQAVDDGMFAIASLIDEIAMGLPDLRPLWAVSPLQATRWTTNNAGVELFERLERVRRGPKPVIATYMAVLGVGFQGRFGLPGADRYALAQLRRRLAFEIGVDADRDWKGGVLKPTRADAGPSSLLPREPWYRSQRMGRALAISAVTSSVIMLGLILWSGLQ